MIDTLLTDLGKTLMVAAIGGGITLAIGVIKSKYKNYRLEKKYPIAGDYISEYEDIEDDKTITIKSPVCLTQKGRAITGTTEFGNRTWILKGEVSDASYLSGIYYAEAIHDKGIGNFFLEIDNNGDMNGMWSGYDSVNKIITSGSYSFTKTLPVLIKPISSKSLPTVLNIAEKQLGNAYINTEDILKKENVSVYASVNNEITGFCTGKKVELEKIYEDIPQLKNLKLKQLDAVESIGLLTSVATDPSYSGRGIGTALVSHCINELESKGLNVLLMTGWKSKKGIHIGNIAEKHGFEKLIEISDFWKEDSITNQYCCPSCGNPPCLCTAAVYVRHSHH